MHILQILRPHIRMYSAKVLSSFVPSIEHRKEPPLRTGHRSHCYDTKHCSDIFVVARAFSYLFLSSNDWLYGAMRDVFSERCRFRRRNR